MFTDKVDVVCSCLVRCYGCFSTIVEKVKNSWQFLLLQRSRNFSALLDDVEMFFICAFAFVWWRIVKNGSETKEHPKKSDLSKLV